jgi:hypothetical protein
LSVFKLFRIVVLLSVLFVIVISAWMTERRMAAWERPILVAVYPIAADDDPASLRAAQETDEADFDAVNQFMDREAAPYGFSVKPAFRFLVAEPGTELPPAVPGQFAPLAIAWWSLKMRWWAWMQDFNDDLVTPDVQMFVLYHAANGETEIGISVGMRKGRYGLVKAYASEASRQTRLIVFTHEMLHVLGATDKYVLTTGEPIFPEGYAEPDKRPLLPQQRAEIMGGRIPVNSFSSVMPSSLKQCKIGHQTAKEIGFYARLHD